jgi:hypothetical protein
MFVDPDFALRCSLTLNNMPLDCAIALADDSSAAALSQVNMSFLRTAAHCKPAVSFTATLIAAPSFSPSCTCTAVVQFTIACVYTYQAKSVQSIKSMSSVVITQLEPDLPDVNMILANNVCIF